MEQHSLIGENRSMRLWMETFYFDTLMKAGQAPEAAYLNNRMDSDAASRAGYAARSPATGNTAYLDEIKCDTYPCEQYLRKNPEADSCR